MSTGLLVWLVRGSHLARVPAILFGVENDILRATTLAGGTSYRDGEN